jgi:hypothetical protein
MNCEHARQLFDAYLDGELSPSLATELGAHRLRCPDCRRDLALLEVTGHVVAHDRAPAQLSEAFSDRLLSCTRTHQRDARRTWLSRLYVAGPLAAAAVVVLALLGVFDRRNPRVAGETVRRSPEEVRRQTADPDAETRLNRLSRLPDENRNDPYARSLDQWAVQAQKTLEAKQEDGASFQQLLELKAAQFLNLLTQPAEKDTPADADSSTAEPTSPGEADDEEPPPADEQDP